MHERHGRHDGSNDTPYVWHADERHDAYGRRHTTAAHDANDRPDVYDRDGLDDALAYGPDADNDGTNNVHLYDGKQDDRWWLEREKYHAYANSGCTRGWPIKTWSEVDVDVAAPRMSFWHTEKLADTGHGLGASGTSRRSALPNQPGVPSQSDQALDSSGVGYTRNPDVVAFNGGIVLRNAQRF